jgi:dTMP kinase
MTGRFVVFEGGEGCGKSTQAERLARRWGAVLTREPGGTPTGRRLRELLLAPPGDDVLDPRTEALLMAADRAQHVAEVIRPALTAGRDVVSDRYIGSSVAYQGWGRGLGDDVARISAWATEALLPDLVVLLDVPIEVAAERTGGARDRIEAAGGSFHERVRNGFRAQADAEPSRWVVVDGRGAPDEVESAVLEVVQARLAGTGR